MPLLRICLEAALDELLGVLANVGPLGPGELVLTRPDPLLHSRGDREAVVGVKRGEAAQSAHGSSQWELLYLPALHPE